MKTYYFSVAIPTKRWLLYYSGDIQTLIVATTTGLTLSLPAFRLRPYTSSAGLHGSFKLVLTDQNGFFSLEKLN